MRILFLSRWYPYPPDNGSKVRVYNLIKQLAAQHEIALLSFFDPSEGPPLALPPGLCSQVWTTPWRAYRPSSARAVAGLLSIRPRSQVATYSQGMARMVADALAGRDFDVAICSQLGTAEYAADLAGVPAVLEELEIGPILGRDDRPPSAMRRLRLGLTRAKLRAYLRRLLTRFAACTVVSEVERTLLEAIVPEYRAVHVLRNAVDAETLTMDGTAPAPDSLVYPGALTFSANLDAMRHFLAECYPLIKHDIPGVRLAITGRHDGVRLGELALDDSVSLTGYVPDVRPFVRQSWACVVPLRTGGGTRVKILEAMALGTPVVATTKAAEGLDVVDGAHVLIADTPQDFAQRTVALLRQPALREQLVSRARELVVERYSWSVVRERLDAVLQDAVGGNSLRGSGEPRPRAGAVASRRR